MKIDINDLTIGQIDQINKYLNGNKKSSDEINELDKFIGKYCIARTRIAGVICGTVVNLGKGFVELKDARRIFRPISSDKSLSWYEGVAESGLCESKGVISGAVRTKLLVEDYEINVCSEDAKKSLQEFKPNETTY